MFGDTSNLRLLYQTMFQEETGQRWEERKRGGGFEIGTIAWLSLQRKSMWLWSRPRCVLCRNSSSHVFLFKYFLKTKIIKFYKKKIFFFCLVFIFISEKIQCTKKEETYGAWWLRIVNRKTNGALRCHMVGGMKSFWNDPIMLKKKNNASLGSRLPSIHSLLFLFIALFFNVMAEFSCFLAFTVNNIHSL